MGPTGPTGREGPSGWRGWEPFLRGDATTMPVLQEVLRLWMLAGGLLAGPRGCAAGDGVADAADAHERPRGRGDGGERAAAAAVPRAGPDAVPQLPDGTNCSACAEGETERGMALRRTRGAVVDAIIMLAARWPRQATGRSSGLGRLQILGRRCYTLALRVKASGGRGIQAPAWDWRGCQAVRPNPSRLPFKP